MTSAPKKPKKSVPLPLKQTRKELPPPTKSFKDRKTYNRTKAKEKLKRTLSETYRLE